MKRVTAELESAILRHGLVDQWPVGTIATQLGVHHDVVRRCLRQHGMLVPAHARRARMVDVYVDFIADTLNKYPRLHASRLYQMVQERGYQGSESHFRRMVAELRPAPVHEPFLRLCKLPAEEAQVDWASFGTVVVGRATRKLYAFVMTLSWSKMAWLQFFFDMQMANFLRGHVDALRFYGGVPRKLLYDNLKSAVLEREGQAVPSSRRKPSLTEVLTGSTSQCMGASSISMFEPSVPRAAACSNHAASSRKAGLARIHVDAKVQRAHSAVAKRVERVGMLRLGQIVVGQLSGGPDKDRDRSYDRPT